MMELSQLSETEKTSTGRTSTPHMSEMMGAWAYYYVGPGYYRENSCVEGWAGSSNTRQGVTPALPNSRDTERGTDSEGGERIIDG